MRKIFKLTLVALALLALTACEKEPASVHDGERYPILFGNTDTRAVADLDDLKDSGFKVYAYVQGNAGSTSFAKDVVYNTANSVWAFESPEYWIPGATYWFKAFYPTTPSAGTLTVDNTSSTQSFTIADFDISKQEDIMVAETAREGMLVDKSTGAPLTGSVVNLKFEHLLANVTIKIKAEINVTINDVSLRFIPVKGSYTDGSWSYATQGNVEMIGLNKALNSSNKEFQDVTNGGFLVFPNSIGDAKLYIRTSNKNYDIKLPATPSAWVAGTKYTYTLTIKQDDILFDEPTVEEWDEENAVGSVIIK